MPIGPLAHTHLPYCIQKTSDGKWLLLNRNYKPLGTVGKEIWVDYDSHPDRVALDHRSVAALKKLAVYEIEDQPEDPGILYFYKDGDTIADTDAAWNSYAKVLQAVAKARVK